MMTAIRQEFVRSDWFSPQNLLIIILVAAKLTLNLGLDQHYGYFRDEFYYMNLGQRVFEGPTAMPLMAPLLMGFTLKILGDSLTALHVLPALAGSMVIVLTVRMARLLGGKLLAQALAGTSVLMAPAFLGVNSTFSYDSFDQLFWVACLFILVQLLHRDNPRLWIAFGITAGLGLFTKETMLFLGFGVALAFLLLPERRHYRSLWMWVGAGISFLFLLPYLIMQAELGWPSLGYWGSYGSSKTYAASPLEFLQFQILAMNPLSAPLWIAGLGWALTSRLGEIYRPLGWTYLILFGLFVLLKVKFYFLVAFYPFLFAAGSVWAEYRASRRIFRIGLYSYVSLIGLTGLALAPYAMPLLPVDAFLQLARKTSGDLGIKQERHQTNLLPQHFADRFGWEEMARKVVAIFQNLSPEDQAKACIFTGNYGEAGAIKFFGQKIIPNLPPVLSGHGQHFFWGCDDCTGEVMILIGVPEKEVAQAFDHYKEADRTHCEYAMPYENNRPIYVAYGTKKPLSVLWPEVGHFD